MYIYLFVEGQKLVAHPTRLHMESDEKAWDFGLWTLARGAFNFDSTGY